MSAVFLRRQHTPHAPLPVPLNPMMCCTHGTPACNRCVPEGTLLFRNHDVEASSWWNGAARNENATFSAFFLLGAIGLALSVHAKQHDNPTHYTTDYLRTSATRG